MKQFAARASSLVLLVAVWLLPTASRANGGMVMEGIAKALGAPGCQMTQGSVAHQQSEPHTSARVWGFHTAYDNVVGALAFGLIASWPSWKA